MEPAFVKWIGILLMAQQRTIPLSVVGAGPTTCLFVQSIICYLAPIENQVKLLGCFRPPQGTAWGDSTALLSLPMSGKSQRNLASVVRSVPLTPSWRSHSPESSG